MFVFKAYFKILVLLGGFGTGKGGERARSAAFFFFCLFFCWGLVRIAAG